MVVGDAGPAVEGLLYECDLEKNWGFWYYIVLRMKPAR
jgi:hypothetical protein